MRNKTTSVLIRMTPEVKKELEIVSEAKGISMSALVTMFIRQEYNNLVQANDIKK